MDNTKLITDLIASIELVAKAYNAIPRDPASFQQKLPAIKKSVSSTIPVLNRVLAAVNALAALDILLKSEQDASR
jgi:hypothetical protein